MFANKVPAAIEHFARAARSGKFTFQAGRADQVTNLVAASLILMTAGQAVRGAHQLLYDWGKKEGY